MSLRDALGGVARILFYGAPLALLLWFFPGQWVRAEWNSLQDEGRSRSAAADCREAVEGIAAETVARLDDVLASNPGCVALKMKRSTGSSEIVATVTSGASRLERFTGPVWLQDIAGQEAAYCAEKFRKQQIESAANPSDPWAGVEFGGPDGCVEPRQTTPDEVVEADGTDDDYPCYWDPTPYNNNWHDDMVCNGYRPYLLPDDDYIEREEIEAAAREWWEARN